MNPTSAVTANPSPQVECSKTSAGPRDHRCTSQENERNKLLEEYLPLVGNVLAKVKRNLPSHVDADDLYSAGVMGLIAATQRFDPEQRSTFTGYACLRIRGAMLDELRRNDVCSRRSRVRNKEIQKAVLEIEQELGRAPNDRELSARLHISVSELMRRRAGAAPTRVVSLDGHPDSDAPMDGSLHEAIADHSQECVRETMEKEELAQLVAERLAALPEIQKRILALYYFEELRFAEIGAVFDLSEARICQIHKQAVAKLRSSIRLNGGE
jgi:RNA polymerase sigma factor for flagellar operon FliA